MLFVWRSWDSPTHFGGDWGCVPLAWVAFLDGLGIFVDGSFFLPVMRCICFLTCRLSLLVFRACVASCGGRVAINFVEGGNRNLA